MPITEGVQHTILPSHYYYNPQIFECEVENIFNHCWSFACHDSQLRNVGDYMVVEIATQSLIIVRSQDEQLLAFYNVCQHRGRELLEASGQLRAIVCPYHGWRYALDGSLSYARGVELVPGFDQGKICLTPVRLEILAGFVFVNLDQQAQPLSSKYAGLKEQLLRYEPKLCDLVHVRRTEFELAVNWKVAVENYLESYHLVNVHPALRNSVKNDEWIMTLYPFYTSLIGQADPAVDTAYDFTQAEQTLQTNWWMWPMMMFEQMPGESQIFTYNHLPLGPERTLQIVDFYFPDTSLTEERLAEIEYIEKVVRIEDKVAIEGVQRGLHSRGYQSGPLMVGPEVPEELTEKGVLHFQSLLTEALQ